MRWPWQRRRPGRPSEEALATAEHVRRAMVDTDRLIAHIDAVTERAHRAASEAESIRVRNHFAEAIAESMQRKARHP
jgi:hypothetical protein